MPAEPLPEPPHRLPALTTSELSRYKHELQHAVDRLGEAPVVEDLRAKLDAVEAEFESRDQLARTVHWRTGL